MANCCASVNCSAPALFDRCINCWRNCSSLANCWALVNCSVPASRCWFCCMNCWRNCSKFARCCALDPLNCSFSANCWALVNCCASVNCPASALLLDCCMNCWINCSSWAHCALEFLNCWRSANCWALVNCCAFVNCSLSALLFHWCINCWTNCSKFAHWCAFPNCSFPTNCCLSANCWAFPNCSFPANCCSSANCWAFPNCSFSSNCWLSTYSCFVAVEECCTTSEDSWCCSLVNCWTSGLACVSCRSASRNWATAFWSEIGAAIPDSRASPTTRNRYKSRAAILEGLLSSSRDSGLWIWEACDWMWQLLLYIHLRACARHVTQWRNKINVMVSDHPTLFIPSKLHFMNNI